MDRDLLKEKLFSEIKRYFNMPAEERALLSQFSRRLVEEQYSAEKMALETLDFYQKVASDRQSPLKIALCGYYGRGNLGDEMILCALRSTFLDLSPRADLRTLSPASPLELLRTLYGARIFVFGGGSLLQNATSNASLIFYLSLIVLARLFCKRSIMLANGIGPLSLSAHAPMFEKIIARALSTFDHVSARDEASCKLLQAALPHRQIELVPDPALIVFSKIEKKLNHRLINYENATPCAKNLVFIPCASALKRSKIPPLALARALRFAALSTKKPPILVLMNKNEDLPLARKVARAYAEISGEALKIAAPTTVRGLYTHLRGAGLIISQRYHGALLGAYLGVPTLPVSSDPKMQALSRELLMTEAAEERIFLSRKRLFSAIERNVLTFNAQKSELKQKMQALSNLSERKIKEILKNYL